jgi:hypothetical protein
VPSSSGGGGGGGVGGGGAPASPHHRRSSLIGSSGRGINNNNMGVYAATSNGYASPRAAAGAAACAAAAAHAHHAARRRRQLLVWGGGALAALAGALAVLLLVFGGGGSDVEDAIGGLPTTSSSSATTTTPVNGPHQSDVRLELGPYFFNPSVVLTGSSGSGGFGGFGGGGKKSTTTARSSIGSYGGVYLATARTAHMKRVGKTNWWYNEAYLCTSARPDFSAVSCRKFDPWHGRFRECLWGNARKAAEVDTTGLEDAKLFVWPGKGVYAVFGRKPEASPILGASPYCVDPVFVQFLVQVVAEDPADVWSIKRPRELKAGAYSRQLYGGKGTLAGQEPIKEKNWMPFVHRDRLFMTHSVHPHRVFEVNSTGVAVAQHLTRNDALFAPFRGEDVHGGPPVVLVPGKFSPDTAGADYYLGVFHFFQTFGEGSGKVKVYHHYAYKTEARPPFRVCAVSRELALVTRQKKDAEAEEAAGGWTHQRIWKDTSQTAYVAGLALVEAGAGATAIGGGVGGRGGGGTGAKSSSGSKGRRHPGGPDVLLSYGSSDIDARLLALPLKELDAMFVGKDGETSFDCSGAQVLDESVVAG